MSIDDAMDGTADAAGGLVNGRIVEKESSVSRNRLGGLVHMPEDHCPVKPSRVPSISRRFGRQ